MPIRQKVPKTRNHFTLTESAFWSMIRSCLRNASRWWKPIKAAKEKVKRNYKGKKPLQKWEYQCAHCKEWFMEKEIAVDHIVECGELKSANDLPGFVERLFCEVEGFQVLCNKRQDGKESCHKKKTDEYMKNKKLK